MSTPRQPAGAAPASASTRSAPTSNAPAVDLDTLAAALAPLIADRMPAPTPEGALLDADGAARLLGVPASWVLQEARADRIPHVRLGRYVRFDGAELRTWAAERGRGPRRRTGNGPVPGGRPGR